MPTPEQLAENERIKQQMLATQEANRQARLAKRTPTVAPPVAPVKAIPGTQGAGAMNVATAGGIAAPIAANTQMPAQNTPVPGSVEFLLSDGGISTDEQFINDYIARQRQAYETPIDERAIRMQKEAEMQAQIDAINKVYADKLIQTKTQGQGRIGSNVAQQARGGLLGSDFGTAQTNAIQDVNRQAENLVEQERLALVNQLLSDARTNAANEIAEKRKAVEAGGKALLDYYAGAGERKAAKTRNAAQKILALGKNPQDVSDEELKQLGISRQDLVIEFTTEKSAQEAMQAQAQAEQEKAALEGAKTEAEINKLYTEANMPREIGGFIFDAQGKPIGSKYEKPEYLKFEQKNADGSTSMYYQNPVTGKRIDPVQSFGADVGYKVDLNAVLGGYSPKGQELLSVPDGTIVPTRLGKVSPQNARIRGKECAEYVNDIAGTKMGDTYASKIAVCNEPTGGVGSVVAWKPKGSGEFGHTGIIVDEDANYYYVKSSNYVPGTVTTEPVPKNNIKNFYTPESVKIQKLPPVSKDILAGIDDLLESPGLNNAVGFGFQKLNLGNQSEEGFIPGTEAENFRAKFNSFRDNMVLPNLSKLKGPMSDKDIQFLRNSATSLNLNMTEKQFKAELKKIKDKIMGISEEDLVSNY